MADPPADAVPLHSVQEEYFYLMVNPCACGMPWRTGDQQAAPGGGGLVHPVHATCPGCGAERTFTFALRQRPEAARPAPVREVNPTDEPSRAIDLGQWMTLARFYLARIERLRDAVAKAQSLLDARQCLEEALKFFPPAAETAPADALWTDAGRHVAAETPDLLTRPRIETMLARLPAKDDLQRVDAPEQREFEKALKQEARRRKGRWWQLWKRRR